MPIEIGDLVCVKPGRELAIYNTYTAALEQTAPQYLKNYKEAHRPKKGDHFILEAMTKNPSYNVLVAIIRRVGDGAIFCFNPDALKRVDSFFQEVSHFKEVV